MSRPSMSLMRNFEAAARLGSLTLAATELGVTPGAVGHAVRALEDWAGLPLLVRQGRKLVPTERALQVLPDIAKGFAILEASADQMRASHQSLITIAVDTSFAARWLVPRLAEYAKQRKGIETRIVQPSFPDPLATPDVDLALVYRRPSPGMEANVFIAELVKERMLPVCAPGLKKRGMRRSGFPHQRPILHTDVARGDEDYPTWSIWCRLAGCYPIQTVREIYFSHAIMALEAAILGQGVALAGETIAATYLEDGRLVVAVDDPPALQLVRYLIRRKVSESRPVVRRFTDFLIDAASKMRQISNPG